MMKQNKLDKRVIYLVLFALMRRNKRNKDVRMLLRMIKFRAK